MKIVGWNLRNISGNKLSNGFGKTFKAYALGNNVLDYMINVVMGDAKWSNLWGTSYAGISSNPADIFVIIELKTGGSTKGSDVQAKCTNALASIVAAMNTKAKDLGVNGNYEYTYAKPLVVGNTESVGVIYNKKVFQSTPAPATAALKAGLNYIRPRTPFMATLVHLTTKNQLKVVGVHAPPETTKKGTKPGQKNKPPVDFSNALGEVADLNPNTPKVKKDYVILGDFNCNPSSNYPSTYRGKRKRINAFGELCGVWDYKTKIPNDTLSSVRVKVKNTEAPPANYLSGAFDNLFYNFAKTTPGTINGYVLNLIANARNMSTPTTPVALYPTNLVACLNAFNVVSDHMPMILEYT